MLLLTRKCMAERKQDVADLLTYYHPYFGVQEALPEQMKDIKNGLKNYDYIGVGEMTVKRKASFPLFL
jgi:hypothetical protein